MRLDNDQGPDIIRGLLGDIVSLINFHEFFQLTESSSVDLVLGFLAVQQMMTMDWSAPGYASWFLYRWKAGEVPRSEKFVHVVREHRRSTGQVFSAVPVTTCNSYMTAKAVRQKLRIFQGEASSKAGKLSGLPSSPIPGSDAYGIDEVYDGDLKEGDWDLNCDDSIPGIAAAFCAREVRASSKRVQGYWRPAGLRVRNSTSDLFSELADASEAVATSSVLKSSPGASVLFFQNELPPCELVKDATNTSNSGEQTERSALERERSND